LEEAGVASLTMDALCERLQDKYQINMKSALNLIVYDVMREPALQIALAKTSRSSSAQGSIGQATTRKTAKRTTAKRRNAKPRPTQKNEPKPALRADMIFANEKRPAIMDAIRARGESIHPADVRDQIAALWDAETHRIQYYDPAEKDREMAAADTSCAGVLEGRIALPPCGVVLPVHCPSRVAALLLRYCSCARGSCRSCTSCGLFLRPPTTGSVCPCCGGRLTDCF
jgi:hypothetical protein